jgi:hypothetical protein
MRRQLVALPDSLHWVTRGHIPIVVISLRAGKSDDARSQRNGSAA